MQSEPSSASPSSQPTGAPTAGASLCGQVADDLGAPVAGALVTISGDGGLGAASQTTDETGTFCFSVAAAPEGSAWLLRCAPPVAFVNKGVVVGTNGGTALGLDAMQVELAAGHNAKGYVFVLHFRTRCCPARVGAAFRRVLTHRDPDNVSHSSALCRPERRSLAAALTATFWRSVGGAERQSNSRAQCPAECSSHGRPYGGPNRRAHDVAFWPADRQPVGPPVGPAERATERQPKRAAFLRSHRPAGRRAHGRTVAAALGAAAAQ